MRTAVRSGSELRLLERPVQHVWMRDDDFTPGFELIVMARFKFKSVPARGPDFGALAAADSMPVQLVISSL